jgi:hypothetical protein
LTTGPSFILIIRHDFSLPSFLSGFDQKTASGVIAYGFLGGGAGALSLVGGGA